MFLGERRTSLSWTAHGQTARSTSSPSLPGLGSVSRRSLTIGFDGWLLNIIGLHSSFLAGLSIGKAPVKALRPQTNFSTRRSVGLVIPIPGLERPGRRARDWRSSLRILEPCWFWT